MINTWLKFEDKIQNTSKVIMFTMNHTDDDEDDDDDADDDDGTKNNMSPRSGGRHNFLAYGLSKTIILASHDPDYMYLVHNYVTFKDMQPLNLCIYYHA